MDAKITTLVNKLIEQQGGLQGIMTKMEQHGLAKTAETWVRKRANLPMIDYPSIGRSRDIAPDALTADRVCADLLRVADAAGFDRFAYCGYSWGGAVGLQLASRTNRLTALVIGGWPPLNAPYANILEASRRKIGNVEPGSMAVLRNADQYRQWSYFYASMKGWPEADAVHSITCPKMVFYGARGDLIEAGLPVNIASIIRTSRVELARQGWEVLEFADYGHEVCMHGSLIVPPIKAFIDRRFAHSAAIQ